MGSDRIDATRVTAGEIARLLNRECETLVAELLPDAWREGGELVADLPDGRLKMCLGGRKRGRWLNVHAERDSGDCLDLIARVKFAGNRKRAFAWACARYGEVSRCPPPSLITARKSEVAEQSDSKRRQARALGQYLAGREEAPEIMSYLQGRLGIDIAELPEPPHSLRFAEQCYHSREAGGLPAMLAPVIHLGSGAHVATHITFLTRYDDGTWRKARVTPAKKFYGSPMGGVIPLARGVSGKRLRDAPAGDRVVLAEGIENALAAGYLARGRARILAAGSLVNLANLILPSGFGEIIIGRDTDADNRRTVETVLDAMQRWRSEGRKVSGLSAPWPYDDLADFLKGEAAKITICEDDDAWSYERSSSD